jgi:cytochrome P450
MPEVYLQLWRDPIKLMVDTIARYGDVASLGRGRTSFLLLNDDEAIHHVLVTNAKNYTKSARYQGLRTLLGDGLLNSEGSFWRQQRKLIQPAFHRPRLHGFARTMAALTSDRLDAWAAETPAPIDLHEQMMRLTFRIVGQTLLSTDVEGDARAVGEALTDSIHWVQHYSRSVVRTPLWVPIPRNLRFQRARTTLDRLVFRIIEERRRPGAPEGDDLLAMLMATRDEATGEGMNDRQLRDELLTMILAGHETTANALTFVFHLLSRYPEVERRAHAEVVEALEGRAPTLDDLPRLGFVERVVLEAMRLYPPAWAFERQAIAADTVAGYAIEPGTMIGVIPYTLHRSLRYWDNPEGFDPDRFLPERSAGRPRFAYLPFGDGPRVCIGRAFAMMEATIIVAMVLQRFRVELVPGTPLALEPGITLRPRGAVSVRLHPR